MQTDPATECQEGRMPLVFPAHGSDPDRVSSRSHASVSPVVTYGLLAAWTIHDLEEVLTFGHFTRTAVPRLRERLPTVPERVWRRLESTTPGEFTAAVGIVGLLMAAASAAGQASGGRSKYFQLMLAGFGLHTIGHVKSAVATRGYTPGLVTSPIVAAPFAFWAIRRLKQADVWQPITADDALPGTALALAVFTGSHTLARSLNRVRREPQQTR
jgi:hypothetical protein